MADLVISVAGSPVPVHLGQAPEAILDAAALSALSLKVGFTDLRNREASLFDWIPANLHNAILARTSTADVSSYVQDGYDEISGLGGGSIHAPDGLYNVANVIAKTGVTLRSSAAHYGYLPTPTYGVRFQMVAGQVGWIIDTPVTSVYGLGIEGINFGGLGAGTPGGGVRLQNAFWNAVRKCHFNNFAEQGFLQVAGYATVLEDILAINCLLDRTRAAKAGAIEVQSGSTDHFLNRIEASASNGGVSGAITDSNLYCCGILIGASNCTGIQLVGELSDVGIHLAGSGLCKFTNCRADLNAGHGWEVTSGSNMFSACHGVGNSQHATNTYDNWSVPGGNNSFSACQSSHPQTKKARYGFNDTVSSGANKNYYDASCFDTGGAVTAAWNFNTSNGSSRQIPTGPNRAFTSTDTTPSVASYTNWITANASATTITNFDDGADGQRIVLLCNDANTTIQHNGSTITLPGSTSRKLRAGHHYVFVRSGLWRLETTTDELFLNTSTITGDNAATLTIGSSAETFMWHAPLTADRAVTLATVDAAGNALIGGEHFRVVRKANATGAFNLNVGTGPLKALAVGQWCDVTYNATLGWVLTGFGSL